MDGPHYPLTRPRLPSAVLAMLVAASALTGCGHAPARQDAAPHAATSTNPPPHSADARANAVVMRAISLVGTPYHYGGNTPESGFDCSGLVNYVYRDMLDLRLPRTSRDLAAWQGPPIDRNHLATGDLVFFGDRHAVSHVGIYVGDGRFVHAPSTGGTVRLDSLDGRYWAGSYSGAKRILSGR